MIYAWRMMTQKYLNISTHIAYATHDKNKRFLFLYWWFSVCHFTVFIGLSHWSHHSSSALSDLHCIWDTYVLRIPVKRCILRARPSACTRRCRAAPFVIMHTFGRSIKKYRNWPIKQTVYYIERRNFYVYGALWQWPLNWADIIHIYKNTFGIYRNQRNR